PLADGVSVPPVVRQLLGERASVGPDGAVPLVVLVQDDGLVRVLKNLRVTQLIEIVAREAERITVIPRIVAQRRRHVAIAEERFMTVVGGLACGRERRLVDTVTRHGNRTVRLDARARSVCRLPGTG